MADECREVMRRRLEAFGLGHHADALLAAGLPSIRLRPTAGDDPPIGASKLGGRPDLPVGMAWPMHQKRALQFMAQIRLGDLVGLPAASALPEAGLLTFFYDELREPRFHTISATGLLPDGIPLVRSPVTETLVEGGLNPEMGLVAEVDFTLFPWAPDFLDQDERFRYWDLIRDDEVHHRMLGYPDLIQDTPTPGAAVLLLQLDLYDHSAFPDGAGRLYFLMTEEDLVGQRFDQVVEDYECD